jgi:hypothetical protein
LFFRVLINLRVAFLGKVASVAKLCCSVAPQVLYSDCSLWRYAITVIAFVALWCKFVSPFDFRINEAKGLNYILILKGFVRLNLRKRLNKL